VNGYYPQYKPFLPAAVRLSNLEKLWNTGWPAGTCRRARRRRDSVAGEDSYGRGK